MTLRHCLRIWLLSLALAFSIGRAWAAEQDMVTLNFVNADIEGVVKVIGQITGRNFVLDPRVKGTVNIISSQPIAKPVVYDVFLAAMRLQGFSAVEERNIVKIVPAAEAKYEPGRMHAPDDRVETRVFTLKHVSAMQLVPVLRPLIAPYNAIAAYGGNNTLVVTDYVSNLGRVARIVAAIDQPKGNEPVVIPFHYASAIDAAQILGRLFAEAPQQGPGFDQPMTLVADPRSNTLIARSDDAQKLARLRGLVAVLDAPTSAAGNIHVVYLKNAEAVSVARTLRAIYMGDSGSSATSSRRGATSLAAQPANQAGNSPGTSPMSASFNAPAASPEDAPAPGIIQADAATNSIIINAPDAIYNNLRAAIDKLDVRREQVYVEAMIAEITSDKAAEFGIQWQNLSAAGATDSTARGFGGTNFGGSGQNILGISQNPALAGQGLNIGVMRGHVTIPGVGEVLNLGMLVRALETDSNVNILSTPTLLTLDNEEAKIVIGQNVPFITGQYALTGAATTPTPFQTIERRDVGLTLRIKPQISQGGTVRLQIYEEVSSIDPSSINNPAGLITKKRALESTVLVNDGQIVVIGGLLEDSVTDGQQKVPLLGDVPVLGSLFRYNTREHSKTNLMLFLRPVVLRNAQSADSIAGERYNYILGEQRKSAPAPSVVLPDMAPPTLPPYSLWNLPR
ncbi:MAG: type II secretion system secretin GspD [Burkholderiales bacterium]